MSFILANFTMFCITLCPRFIRFQIDWDLSGLLITRHEAP